ncbi:hypothetical protein [Anaerosporobacter faecicola]|uniref:hypothetical protein n=1 Tax=Anaerosporobacter faecicola TaxID=2718714 RepID=UPI00143B5FBC|nr:hypothetical protein [Anaerosporobacter faecicola]
MMSLLVLKERLITIYQKIEVYAKPVVRFFISMLVFMVLNNSYGYDLRFNSLPIVLLLAAFCAFLPTPIMIIIAALLSFIHFYFVSKILSILVIAVFLVIYLLFIRFTPKQGYVLILMPICFLLKIPYVIPILLGIIGTPMAIIPVSCGVFLYFFIVIIKQAAQITVSMTVEDTLQLYTFVIDSLKANKEMILTIAVFAIVLLLTYFIRTRKMDHAFDIAIVTGVVVNIFVFLIGDLRLDIQDKILALVVGSIVSGIIVYVVQFFRLTLDYTAVEYVQFQDDDYYYYVKAVPKMKITVPQKNVTKINEKKVSSNRMNVKEAVKNELYDDEFEDKFDEFDDYPDEDKKR